MSGHLRHPPPTQALASSTFRPPPLDGSLELAEIYDWHLQNTPSHPLFVFARDNGGVKTILWRDAIRAIHVGTRIIRNTMNWKPTTKGTIAILSVSDTISYFITLASIFRAGYVAFPISQRNSVEAVAHLLHKAGVNHVFVGHDSSMKELANGALELLNSQNQSDTLPTRSLMPLYSDLFVDEIIDPKDIPYERQGMDSMMCFAHSSGSTDFPKPLCWTQAHFIELCLVPYFGERDLTGKVLSLHTIPMFHGLGIMQTAWTASTGLILSVFEPKSPAIVPTPLSQYEAAVATDCDLIFSVPAIIEAWSKNPKIVEWLATRDGVLYGGGPLNKSIGDYLVSQGANIFNVYGLTEGGILSPFLSKDAGYDWDYFRFPDNVTAEMVPQGDGTYEFVILPNAYYTLRASNGTFSGRKAYFTSDLFIPHPQKPGYWRIHGRSDDQIMHSTGEKTNPGPLETIINQDPHVQACVMFGRGQFQAGILIDPKPAFKVDLADGVQLAAFRNEVWETIQRANAFAPQHSRIFKEMILISKASKPFQYTGKGTVCRQVVLKDYKDEIEALYRNFASSTQAEIAPPPVWTSDATLRFVRKVVDNVLINKAQDDEDLFQHGCDSLQATWIRNSLLRALHKTAQLDIRPMVNNFVYNHPTIAGLSNFVQGLATGKSDLSGELSQEARVAAMQAMVDQYTNFPPSPRTSSTLSNPRDGITVLLTGTTGAVGVNLLAQLVSHPSITRVYALNRLRRADQASLKEEQLKAFNERGFQGSAILSSSKVVLQEANLVQQGFGLDDTLYQEMRGSVTHIIHNAWPVNFNLGLASFETSIKGLRNLIDFALHTSANTPPSLILISTVGVFGNIQAIDTETLQENRIPPSVAFGLGYAESKWVAEEIVQIATKETPLNTLIVRLGQLSGGQNGAWNISEWFPSLVKTSLSLGCIPKDNRNVSWIPLDVAAKCILDLIHTPRKVDNIVHLTHPRPVSWSSIASVICSELSLRQVSYEEWLEALDQAQGVDPGNRKKLPALRLLPLFRGVNTGPGKNYEALGLPSLDITKALEYSEFMRSEAIESLTEEDVKKWLNYWRSSDFLIYTREG